MKRKHKGKYVVTYKNAPDLAGRIYKYFKSCCESNGMSHYPALASAYTKELQIRCYEYGNLYEVTVSEHGIEILEPVYVLIPYGSYIHFLGGNLIVIREYLPEINSYSFLVTVFERFIGKNYRGH